VADADGPVGLFVLDPFAREGKRGGAWMSALTDQSHLLGERPIVTNTLNIPKPPEGQPALLSPDEVRTLFHEFGHALHGLLSDVRYPRLAGTEVPADFVEFPSQVNEMWAWEPETLAHYARHADTGEPLPDAERDALLAAQRYGSGYGTVEVLAAMLLDQAWHALAPGETVEDVDAFEREALERHGVALAQVPPRYGSSYFLHIFGSGYGAAYYSYLWAEVLDADAAAWFREQGGLRRASGDAFRRAVLSRGSTVEPMEAYRTFTGREPSVEPLLERLGLVAA
jgi:peptidyl-dipeptidase Dcp